MEVEKASGGASDFENVEMGEPVRKVKVPRKTIYFASGETMEEYSTDEEEEEEPVKKDVIPVDPSKLTWGPYFWFHMWRMTTSTISGDRSTLRSGSHVSGDYTSKVFECLSEMVCKQRKSEKSLKPLVKYWNISRLYEDAVIEECIRNEVCDFMGEKLASLFGISTPKYQYAIDEYYRMKKEEEEEEEENHLAEEAERRFAEQRRSDHNDHSASQPATVAQPEASGASFVNISFELEPEPSLSVPDTNRLPSPLPS